MLKIKQWGTDFKKLFLTVVFQSSPSPTVSTVHITRSQAHAAWFLHDFRKEQRDWVCMFSGADIFWSTTKPPLAVRSLSEIKNPFLIGQVSPRRDRHNDALTQCQSLFSALPTSPLRRYREAHQSVLHGEGHCCHSCRFPHECCHYKQTKPICLSPARRLFISNQLGLWIFQCLKYKWKTAH